MSNPRRRPRSRSGAARRRPRRARDTCVASACLPDVRQRLLHDAVRERLEVARARSRADARELVSTPVSVSNRASVSRSAGISPRSSSTGGRRPDISRRRASASPASSSRILDQHLDPAVHLARLDHQQRRLQRQRRGRHALDRPVVQVARDPVALLLDRGVRPAQQPRAVLVAVLQELEERADRLVGDLRRGHVADQQQRPRRHRSGPSRRATPGTAAAPRSAGSGLSRRAAAARTRRRRPSTDGGERRPRLRPRSRPRSRPTIAQKASFARTIEPSASSSTKPSTAASKTAAGAPRTGAGSRSPRARASRARSASCERGLAAARAPPRAARGRLRARDLVRQIRARRSPAPSSQRGSTVDWGAGDPCRSSTIATSDRARRGRDDRRDRQAAGRPTARRRRTALRSCRTSSRTTARASGR